MVSIAVKNFGVCDFSLLAVTDWRLWFLALMTATLFFILLFFFYIAAICEEVKSALEEIGPLTELIARRIGQCLLQAARIEIEFLKRRFESKKMTKEEAASCVIDCRAKLRRLLEVARVNTTNEIKTTDFVEQAAFDDCALVDWARRKHLSPIQKRTATK